MKQVAKKEERLHKQREGDKARYNVQSSKHRAAALLRKRFHSGSILASETGKVGNLAQACPHNDDHLPSYCEIVGNPCTMSPVVWQCGKRSMECTNSHCFGSKAHSCSAFRVYPSNVVACPMISFE